MYRLLVECGSYQSGECFVPIWKFVLLFPSIAVIRDNLSQVATDKRCHCGVTDVCQVWDRDHFFGQLYPRADITYSVITSTSSWYKRMITADHLVCPPGVGCLLPAIARDAYTYVYETTTPTVGSWLTCTPQDYLNRLTIPSFPPSFVEGDCRHLRARIGAWTNDLALAPSLQYSTSVDGYLGLRIPTLWRVLMNRTGHRLLIGGMRVFGLLVPLMS